MSYYRKLYDAFEKSFYLSVTAGILVSSCLGGITAMIVLMKGFGPVQMVQVFLITCVCMGYNTAVLAGLKPKPVYHILLASVLTNLSVILFNAVV
ncbi:hypothetical protein [Sinomicrobium soli]|uniref:hypothetical protein n=1 Tax=Sinomicrobium sp. N-1-3-6 TaxID=2219864 RepID=UPI000DCF1624|nr:hypothetical protein [Sinomicrobium sp. N-1-3-6]RAV30032.1 hypothetical protein DN748_04320 [Sinomicrobium sp. N-1-3-6]